MEEFRRCFQSENVRKNVFDNLDKQTICHGDCHGWNHMFLKDEQKAGNNNLPSVIAVDFGMVWRIWNLVPFRYSKFGTHIEFHHIKNMSIYI